MSSTNPQIKTDVAKAVPVIILVFLWIMTIGGGVMTGMASSTFYEVTHPGGSETAALISPGGGRTSKTAAVVMIVFSVIVLAAALTGAILQTIAVKKDKELVQ